MWPEQQPPGGEQNPQSPGSNPYQQPGYQQPNPYQQPGYQQPNPYQQPTGGQPAAGPPTAGQPQWGAPTFPMGTARPGGPDAGGGGGNGGGNRTKVTALVAAGAVVVAAGVTGFLVFGGDDGESDTAAPKPSKSATKKPSPKPSDDDNPRGTGNDPKPTVPGWQVVVNPKWGTAFDVPPDWTVKTPDTFVGYEDHNKGDGSKPLIIMSAPAFYKEKWCSSDEDKDGRVNDSSLASVGTKGQNGAKSTKEVARNDSAWWVFGGYTSQKKADKKNIKIGKVESYTTKSGVQGSVVTTTSVGDPGSGKCDSNGKATTFSFKNDAGDYVAWTLHGAKGVKGEVPDSLVKQILATVRLHGAPNES
ncbi:hypothetical protein [Streptomyces sp. NRRL B-1347]|uniref:hypothetical protein n=1 Tax=Streptomyces sp. NRRL B-1347 TaxID=1476877 RepID=UPI0004CAE484|nr:hypothetical protein [Streptomyces sp. NRRL B-1347]